ncbi:hypothetical protein [Tumebacillus permanentifrigoris]|uniref:Uncharacterized protein n=1 Tax=Tumebacillus permanentifrigoris TaxID=378543 RepID=A0A316DBE9_9BACL|nr:hypothetical protein [Tumebacillus permanentifrigoris]PWK11476.1 hypothetical protein C7459_1104 [Tumebacillus permanentifrigoris]
MLTHPIVIRWPNEDTGSYFKIPGCLVNDNTALAIFDLHLEVHLVTATDDPNEYDLQFASNPLFYVGDDLPMIFHDLAQMSLYQFASKYTHSEYFQPERVC